MTRDRETGSCRLCGQATRQLFRRLVLCRHDVGYHGCTVCGCQQTDLPYWLDQAYAIPGVHVDVGAGTRQLQSWLGVVCLLDRLFPGVSCRGLDFGGGSGLLTRLLRDVGHDVLTRDRYADGAYANYFKTNCIPDHLDVLTAFEVFEHMVSPGIEIGTLLAARPRLIVFTTWFNDGQGEDWSYYNPLIGQHVFFYSFSGLARFVETRGYKLRHVGIFTVMIRDGAADPRLARVLDEIEAGGQGLLESAAPDILRRVLFGASKAQAHDAERAMRRFELELAAAGPASDG